MTLGKNDIQQNVSAVMLRVIRLCVVIKRYAECRYNECRYVECPYAECRYGDC